MNDRRLALLLLPVALSFACRGTEVGIPPTDAGPDGGPPNLPDANVIVPDGGRPDADFVVPTLNSVQPGRGSEEGGTRVVLRGTGFSEPAEVRFAGTEATSVTVLDEVSIAATTPAGAIGKVTVEVMTPGGTAELVDGYEYLAELRVLDVEPARVPEEGGVRVAISGEGFDDQTLIFFDRIPLRGATLISSERIEGYVPALSPGRPEIVAVNTKAKARRSDLLFVYATPDPRELAPGYGPAPGGGEHALSGDGFEDASLVAIGGQRSGRYEIVSGERIELRAPSGLPAGRHDVFVANADASGTLVGGMVLFDPIGAALVIDGVIPGRASSAGGDVVTVIGSGFGADAQVVIDGQNAATQFQSAHVVTAIVPTGLSVGSKQVGLFTGTSSVGAADALRIFDPIQLSDIDPKRTALGTPVDVTITGSGFTAGVDVRVADVPLQNVVVVSDTEITGRVVVGAAGAQDLRVSNADAEAVLEDAFIFDAPFEVIRIEPTEGSVAGNTFVSVYGRGFAGPVADDLVQFGGVDGAEPAIENGNLLHVRTPPGATGRVDVDINTSASDANLPSAFSYYDPTLLTGGAWGGAIDGSINVSVVDIDSGQPMPGVVVQLGFDADPSYARLTDENGLATISGPEIRGAQTVTAGQNGIEFVTFMELDAKNLTIFSSVHPVNPDPPPPPQPCPMPGEGPIVRGRVYKFKSTLDPVTSPGWVPVAQITYSQPSVFAANPPDPPTQFDFVFTDGGEFEITPMRAGTIAVYAILGDFNQETQQFIPRKFGVVRQVPSVPGEITEGVNISLDFNLDQTVPIRLDDPPVQVPGPSGNIVFPYLNLGSEGVIGFNPSFSVGGGLFNLTGMPDIAGSSFFYLAGSMTISAAGQFGSPYSLSIVESASELSDGVDAGPFLRMPQNVTPKRGQLLESGKLSWEQPGIIPDVTTIFVVDSTVISGSCCIDANMNGLCDTGEPVQGGGAPVQFGRWSIFAKGGLQSYVMPRMLPGLSAFDTPRTYFYVVQQAIAPRFNYREFIYNQFSPYFWKSWTVSFDQFLAKEETD